jgi:hypothetical protein
MIMGDKTTADVLTQQIDEARDRAADLLASDGGARGGSGWPGRLLWVGLGVVIGAAAAGGRLLKLLPAQLANRLENLIGEVTSAVGGLAEKAGSLGSDTGELAGEATVPADATIDVTEQAAQAVTDTVGQG